MKKIFAFFVVSLLMLISAAAVMSTDSTTQTSSQSLDSQQTTSQPSEQDTSGLSKRNLLKIKHDELKAKAEADGTIPKQDAAQRQAPAQ